MILGRHGMEDITALVARVRNNRSNAEIGEAGGIGERAVQSWASKKGPAFGGFPTVETLKGLAKGLGVSEAHTLLAIATSLGVDTSKAMLLDEAAELPEDGQEAIRSMAKFLLETHRREQS